MKVILSVCSGSECFLLWFPVASLYRCFGPAAVGGTPWVRLPVQRRSLLTQQVQENHRGSSSCYAVMDPVHSVCIYFRQQAESMQAQRLEAQVSPQKKREGTQASPEVQERHRPKGREWMGQSLRMLYSQNCSIPKTLTQILQTKPMMFLIRFPQKWRGCWGNPQVMCSTRKWDRRFVCFKHCFLFSAQTLGAADKNNWDLTAAWNHPKMHFYVLSLRPTHHLITSRAKVSWPILHPVTRGSKKCLSLCSQLSSLSRSQ